MSKSARSSASIIVSLAGLALDAVPAPAQEPVPMGAEFQISGSTAADQLTPSASSDADGNFVVVWTSDAVPADRSVRGRRYDASGNPLGSAFKVNQSSVPLGSLPDVSSATGGEFVVVWTSLGNPVRVLARRFEAGAPSGGEFRASTNTTDVQQEPVVAAAADGSFVVAWASGNGPTFFDYYEIFARRFDADGAPLGFQFQVNTYDYLNQDTPAIASSPDGRFVVVWESHWQDGSLGGVFGQRYAVDGTRLGSEFQVNTTTTDFQFRPGVAMHDDGGFVVVWETLYPLPGRISGRRYDAAGNALGTEFEVALGVDPDVTAEGDGGFLVAWGTDDGTYDEVLGLRYDASGAPVGGHFQINSYTTGVQRLPTLAAAADGRFVVAWESEGQVGPSTGIFGQRYAGPNLHLEADGACPGPVTATIANAPPGSEVGVIAAANTNGFVKGGTLCAGTELEIGEPFHLPPRWVIVDGAGNGSVSFELPAGRCLLEALALAACETSSAVRVPPASASGGR
jgi:hypothetical protein